MSGWKKETMASCKSFLLLSSGMTMLLNTTPKKTVTVKTVHHVHWNGLGNVHNTTIKLLLDREHQGIQTASEHTTWHMPVFTVCCYGTFDPGIKM